MVEEEGKEHRICGIALDTKMVHSWLSLQWPLVSMETVTQGPSSASPTRSCAEGHSVASAHQVRSVLRGLRRQWTPHHSPPGARQPAAYLPHQKGKG